MGGRDPFEQVRMINGNDARLLEPTRCKILRPIWVGGKVAPIDAIVTLPRADAESLAAIRKVKVLA